MLLMKYDRIGFGSFFSFFFLFPIFWDLLILSHRFHLIAAGGSVGFLPNFKSMGLVNASILYMGLLLILKWVFCLDNLYGLNTFFPKCEKWDLPA